MGSVNGSHLHDESCACWKHVLRLMRNPSVTCGRTDQLLMCCRPKEINTAIVQERDCQLKLIQGYKS